MMYIFAIGLFAIATKIAIPIAIAMVIIVWLFFRALT